MDWNVPEPITLMKIVAADGESEAVHAAEGAWHHDALLKILKPQSILSLNYSFFWLNLLLENGIWSVIFFLVFPTKDRRIALVLILFQA